MGSAPSPPPPPDPKATAQAQGQMNKETAIAQAQLNMVNQNTPTGSLSYQQTGTGPDGTPTYTATTSLTPQQQQIFNTTQNLQGNLANLGLSQTQKIGNILNTPFSIPSSVSAPGVYSPVSAPGAYTGAETADQVLARIKSNTNDLSAQILDPVWNARQTALENQLRNQGVAPGSEAYRNAVTDFNNQRNQAYLQASLPYTQQAQSNVLGALGAEQSGQAQQYGQQANNINLGMAQQAQQFGQQTQNNQAAIQNALIERNQPINEISALMGGSQVSMPQFSNVPQEGIQSPDYIGAVNNNYQGQLAAYNSQVANNSAMMGGLFGIPSALLGGWAYGGFKGISDRRLKTDIKRIGASANGLATYSFRYIFDLSRNVIGYMADEVEKVCPEAVFELNGFKAVDYERAVYA